MGKWHNNFYWRYKADKKNALLSLQASALLPPHYTLPPPLLLWEKNLFQWHCLLQLNRNRPCSLVTPVWRSPSLKRVGILLSDGGLQTITATLYTAAAISFMREESFWMALPATIKSAPALQFGNPGLTVSVWPTWKGSVFYYQTVAFISQQRLSRICAGLRTLQLTGCSYLF